ncbi:hypothetical protein [Mesorhizobium sp. M0213]|uniref:hypothetical protein n=1 Tax=unclassified Mesorhizobium TaxID=325217 RepID=UPI003334BA9B
MKVIVFDAIGSPRDVLYMDDLPMPRIGDGEVLVRMVSASINPGDFLFIQDLYPEPKKPHFPRQIAGNQVPASSKPLARMSCWNRARLSRSAIMAAGPSTRPFPPNG